MLGPHLTSGFDGAKIKRTILKQHHQTDQSMSVREHVLRISVSEIGRQGNG